MLLLHCKGRRFLLYVMALSCIAGCTSRDAARDIREDELVGTWAWAQRNQDFYQGTLILEREEGEIVGTINDLKEHTYGDQVESFEYAEGLIRLKRVGENGIQFWEGQVLSTADGLLFEGSFTKEGQTGKWQLTALKLNAPTN